MAKAWDCEGTQSPKTEEASAVVAQAQLRRMLRAGGGARADQGVFRNHPDLVRRRTHAARNKRKMASLMTRY